MFPLFLRFDDDGRERKKKHFPAKRKTFDFNENLLKMNETLALVFKRDSEIVFQNDLSERET